MLAHLPLHGEDLVDEFSPPAARFTHLAMLKASILCVAFVYALLICGPVQAADKAKVRPYITTTEFGTAVYTVPSAFPTSEFPSMEYMPSGREGAPRPVITKVTGGEYSKALNDPMKLPSAAPSSEGVLPQPSSSAASKVGDKDKYRKNALRHLESIIDNNQTSTCDRCRSALRYGQKVSRAAPDIVPGLMVDLCKKYKYEKNPTVDIGCEGALGASQLGGVYTQVLSFANFEDGSPGLDYLCARYIYGNSCELPEMDILSQDFLSDWFNGQLHPPAKVVSRSKKVGPKADKKLRALHASDFHVDARYLVGAEGACTSGQCCRSDSFNKTLWDKPVFEAGTLPRDNISEPASYYGYYHCDPPWSLIAAGMQGISGIIKEGGDFDVALFTGDLATHDADWHISQDLVKYSEESLYDMFHRHLGNTTMVVALGNHDSSPADFVSVSDLPDNLSGQLSWDYDNVAALVKSNGWGNDSITEKIKTHYGGYSISPRQGLRMVALNSDFWYKGNPMSYLDLSNPDRSGMLRWLTDELQEAEDRNERVWIIAHVLTGWSGRDALDNPTNLFYHIVSRYSHTIAHIFFGHTHEDEFQVFYESSNGNSSSVSKKTKDARAMAFIGPSLTPLTNVNPSLRVYEVDPQTYEVMDYLQYYTPVSEFGNVGDNGPIWHLLYKARETYGTFRASLQAGTYDAPVALSDDGVWPDDAPLNASFWAALTDEMEQRPSLVELHHMYQGRNSPRSPSCSTKECHEAKICYMRSGSSNLGRSCPSGFDSVQGG
ncbi:hypothetical protein MVES1_002564 [Malassezia vespertilionis]|uniref:uncharacterized protein n=1 Tax=Malassezia vespertilionis TaxID=2020962 RepID=UPI0024B05975|nr:uncharacterized protein MVES1_002564 [Malassezia vespertilionis]WFD07205.1 hypothetical protein MVES1_002564 [Malassezia vespertilionis]